MPGTYRNISVGHDSVDGQARPRGCGVNLDSALVCTGVATDASSKFHQVAVSKSWHPFCAIRGDGTLRCSSTTALDGAFW
jgi:hypothetical protein